MRILVIYQFFLRPGEPGGTRFNDFCAQWRRAGHQVEVLASSVPYTTGVGVERRFPWVSKEESDMDVTRVWAVDHPDGRRRRRLASMLSFGALAIPAALRRGQPDVVIASSPALITAIPGALAAAGRGAKFVFEVRDLWPESAVTTGVVSGESPLVRAAEGLEAWAYETADAVVALTPGIRDDIVARGLRAAGDVAVIPNGVDVAAFPSVDRDALRASLGWEDQFVAIYSGAHGIANDLDQVVEAARLLRNEPEFQIVAVGEGPRREALVRRTEELGLTNLHWERAVPPARLRQWLQAADVGLVVLQDNPTFRTVYPNKAFEYMAAELPVVCGVDGVLRELVVDGGAGVFVPPASPRRLVAALRELRARPGQRDEMGRRGREIVEQQFDRRDHAMRYLDLLSHLHRIIRS